MDNNFKFKTRHVSIVQRSSSVVNSFVSSVELIQAMTYKLKRDTNQNFEKLTYNFKMRETWNNTCASTTLNIRKKIVKIEIITMVITQNVMRTNIYISSRIFENIPQNGPEYSHRKLAIASFLVTAVRKNIGGLLSWLVSLTSSVPELTRHGLERGLHVNP